MTRYSSSNNPRCCLPILLKEYLRQVLATTGTSFLSRLMDEFSLGLVVVWDSVFSTLLCLAGHGEVRGDFLLSILTNKNKSAALFTTDGES